MFSARSFAFRGFLRLFLAGCEIRAAADSAKPDQIVAKNTH
jgi:hypothetical protein